MKYKFQKQMSCIITIEFNKMNLIIQFEINKLEDQTKRKLGLKNSLVEMLKKVVETSNFNIIMIKAYFI